MTDLAVIGCGYVGLVTATCFAEMGYRVHGIDIDAERVAMLQAGQSPVFEPGLDALIRSGLASGRLSFHGDYADAADGDGTLRADVVFIAVNTPSSRRGAADLHAVRDAVAELAPHLRSGAVIVNKSTVPIGTAELVEGMARRSGASTIAVVSNPEFLREGSAVRDFMAPDRIVLGSNDAAALERVAALYAPLNAAVHRTDVRTAEMIKYASNAFLATKISFVNEIAAICDATGADVLQVAAGMGADPRIGSAFLNAGLGWGGSCFPKDVQSLAHVAASHGAHPQLLRSVMEINADQRRRVVGKIREAVGTLENSSLLVLGAAFKPGTDDIRNSPALELAELLTLEGARVAVYDPVVPAERITREVPDARPVSSVREGAVGADAIVIGTEWDEFRQLPLGELGALMRRRVLVDTRHCVSPDAVRAAGFRFRSIGRPAAEFDEDAALLPATPARVGGSGVALG